jgi:putative DNA primase/helicase
VVGLDLDHCGDQATGELAPLALQIIELVASYAEWSPGASGIRIFARATLPDGPRKRGDLEAYQSGRYLTCTGHHVPGTPREILPRQAEIEAAYRLMFPERAKSVASESRARDHSHARPINATDQELIDRARAAADGGKFARLWAGDWSGYGSQSDADEALCFKLAFWTNRDAARIDALFRQSGLYRSKWDARHYGDGRTYGQGAVDKAVAEVTEAYRPGSGLVLRGPIVRRPDGLRVRHLPPTKRPRGVPAPPLRRAAVG